MVATRSDEIPATSSAEDRRGAYVRQMLERLIDRYPRRAPGSDDERGAQETLGDEFARLGGENDWHRFRYSANLYAVLGLHFGLATLASLLFLVHPLVAAALHLVVLVSYVGDAVRLFQPLRQLLPRGNSQNLLVRFPARQALRRRLVVMAHADAAFTGWIFDMKPPRPFAWRPLRILQRPMVWACLGLLISTTIGVRAYWPETLFWWTYPSYAAWGVYFLVLAVINLQVAWNRRTVPGANDNLAACVGLVVLAERLAEQRPDDVELVFVVTGSEEAGTGGSLALVRAKRREWDREETVIVNLDGIGDGPLHILEEGDVFHLPATRWLKKSVRELADEAELDDLTPFTIPVGGTDALPFLVRGYSAVTLGGIVPDRGAPRHYHRMSDSPENIHYEQVVTSLEFSERLLRKLGRFEESGQAAEDDPPSARKTDPTVR